MGPVLFIAFTADLAKEVTGCKFVAYADDAALLVSANTITKLKQNIESCVEQVQKWYTENGLLINSDKTEFMVMKQAESREISVKNGSKTITIKSKSCLKILGMKVDNQLTWKNHSSQIKQRTTNAIKNIARANNVLSLPSRLILTNALVVPHYNYGDVVYDGCTAGVANDLERNQNYAARAMLGAPKFSSATSALHQLDWIPLRQRRQIHQCVFIHKAIRNKSSYHATHSITNLLPKHSYSTRQKNHSYLNSWQHSTALAEKSALYRATHAWNSFPRKFREIEDTKNFKDSLQKFLIAKFKDSEAMLENH